MIDNGDILIVDDTHASLRLLTDVLTKEGYQVRPADSGELALSSVAAKLPARPAHRVGARPADRIETPLRP